MKNTMKQIILKQNNNKKKILKIILHIISFLLGISLIFIMGYYMGLEQFLSELKKINPFILIPLIIVYSFSWFFRAARLKRIMYIFKKKIPILESLSVEIIGNFANLVLPAKLGDITKIIYLKKKKDLNYKKSTFIVLLIRIMDLLALLLLMMISALFISQKILTTFSHYLILAFSFFVLLTIFCLIFYFKPSIYYFFFIGPLKKILPIIKKLRKIMVYNIIDLFSVYCLSLLVWIFDVLTLYIFIEVYNINLSIAEMAFVLLLSNLIKAIPITPNGLGFYEGAMIVLLGSFGVSYSLSFTIALLDHGFMNLYTLILGFYSLSKLKINLLKTIKKPIT
jgi:glycosyltransferase AglD